jgi:hypothetical protein
MISRVLYPLVLATLILLGACTSPQVDQKTIEEAARATVAAIRSAPTPLPRYVDATRIVEVTRVVDVTRVVEVTQVVTVTARIEATDAVDTPRAQPTSDNSTQPASTSVAGGWKVSEYFKTNASIPYAEGEPGKLSVVLQGICYDSKQSVCLVVRNNTAVPVGLVQANGVARAPDGTMLAVGESQGFRPKYVKPGEIALGYVYFGVDLPAKATYEIELSARDEEAASEGLGDLKVAEAAVSKVAGDSYTTGRVLGMLRNPGNVPVTGPIEVEVYCFEKDGLWKSYSNFTPKDRAEPGGTVPFQVDLHGPCPTYLIAASGFRF